jgi:glycerol-3-phosphate acyltransferase PlsY
MAVGVAVLVGHWFPLFLRFRGGAGLGPSMGVGFGIHPLAAFISTLVGLFTVWRVVHNSVYAVGVGFAGFLVVGPLLGVPLPLALAVVGVPFLAAPRRYVLPWAVHRLQGLRRRRASRAP